MTTLKLGQSMRVIPMHSQGEITVIGSDGEGTFNAATGEYIEGAYEWIGKLDLEEWRRKYPDEDPTGHSWDILDWAFWTNNGQYEPRVEGFNDV